MKKWVKAGIYCLLVLALAVGLGLPTAVAYLQDQQTDQSVKTVSATSVQLDLGTSMGLLQKYRITEEVDSAVELDSAQNMNEAQALKQLMSGLEVLFPENDEEIPFVAEGFSEANHSVYLKIEDENSMIYWDFILENDDGDRINAKLDDETGAILYLKYSLNTDSEPDKWEDISLLGRPALFLNQESGDSEGDIFSAEGLFGNAEETGYSTEEYTEDLQKLFCDTYLRRKGYRFSWEVSESRHDGNSYLYSVMLVDNEGGYYVLTFSVSNNEIIINP